MRRVFEFCCEIMAEMGNMFNMSYERINVILFCYVEPVLFALAIFSLLYVLLKVPGYTMVGKAALIIMGAVIVIVALLLMISMIRLLLHYNSAPHEASLINNASESSQLMLGMFDGTVDWLMKLATVFHTTYSAVNVWVYIIIMPLGIVSSILIILKSVL